MTGGCPLFNLSPSLCRSNNPLDSIHVDPLFDPANYLEARHVTEGIPHAPRSLNSFDWGWVGERVETKKHPETREWKQWRVFVLRISKIRFAREKESVGQGVMPKASHSAPKRRDRSKRFLFTPAMEGMANAQELPESAKKDTNKTVLLCISS